MPRDDASGGQGLTIASLHDTDFSRRNNHGLRDRHREQQRIDPIGAGRDELHLRPTLSVVLEEGARILEGVTIHLASDDASTRQRLAVASLDTAHLSRRHGEEFNTVHRVLPRPESDMEARRQGIRLIAGLTVQGDDPSVREPAVRAEEGELLDDDADAVVRHDDYSEQPENPAVAEYENDDDRGCDEQPVMDDVIPNDVEDGVHDGLQ